jgi:hypothetical protein
MVSGPFRAGIPKNLHEFIRPVNSIGNQALKGEIPQRWVEPIETGSEKCSGFGRGPVGPYCPLPPKPMHLGKDVLPNMMGTVMRYRHSRVLAERACCTVFLPAKTQAMLFCLNPGLHPGLWSLALTGLVQIFSGTWSLNGSHNIAWGNAPGRRIPGFRCFGRGKANGAIPLPPKPGHVNR